MKKYLVNNAMIVPVDDERSLYFRGDLLVSGERIEKIVERPETIEPDDDIEIITGENLIVMPGLVNGHGHTAMTLFRSYADDMPLQEWLEEKIWPIEELLSAEDVYWGTLLGIAEMIKGGTTTFTDMYFFMDQVAEAAVESGMRAVLSRGLVGLTDEDEKGLQETEEFIKRWHGAEEGRINVTIGPHSPYTCPPEYLKKVMALAEKTGKLLQIHLSETRKEVEDSMRQWGFSPPEQLYNMGFLDYPVIAAHCVHLTERDFYLLQEKNVGVIHNPGSNLKLGSGIASTAGMLGDGIRVGLGTDGAASNNNLDMIEEMRLAALISKGASEDPTLIDAATATKMATINGAEILGLSETGKLREGYKADLIGLRCDRPHLIPMHDPVAHLVYAAQSADVELVMVDGRILLEKGKLKTLDEEKIKTEAEKCAFRLREGIKKKR
ncbi:MAG: amidohydrolase [Bacillota bacterium]|nr:amidohydrolase [Bacillota bacterium]